MSIGKGFEGILGVKKEKIVSHVRRTLAKYQYEKLMELIVHSVGLIDRDHSLRHWYRELEIANEALWNLEDRIRRLMGGPSDPLELADVARQIVTWNDRRFMLKGEIDKHVGDSGGEVKELPNYDA